MIVRMFLCMKLGRQYSFMTIGPVSLLSFSGSPLFFDAFNSVEAFLDANRLKAR